MSYAVKKISGKYPHVSEAEIYWRLRYSTFVNFDRRYLYFEVPKAACTAMKAILHKVEELPPIVPLAGPLIEVARELFIHDRDQFKLPSLVDFNDNEQREIFESDSFFRFTVVRNPYARLQSAWRDKVLTCQPMARDIYLRLKGSLPTRREAQSFISFAEFVEFLSTESPDSWDSHWRIQADHLFFEAFDFCHIGHIEEMKKTVELFYEKSGFSGAADDRPRNESFDLKQYDEALASRAWALYERDFKVFGYARESWPQFAPAVGSQQGLKSVLGKAVLDLAERNIVIGTLYEQRARLSEQLQLARDECDDLQRRLRSSRKDMLIRIATGRWMSASKRSQ